MSFLLSVEHSALEIVNMQRILDEERKAWQDKVTNTTSPCAYPALF